MVLPVHGESLWLHQLVLYQLDAFNFLQRERRQEVLQADVQGKAALATGRSYLATGH